MKTLIVNNLLPFHFIFKKWNTNSIFFNSLVSFYSTYHHSISKKTKKAKYNSPKSSKPFTVVIDFRLLRTTFSIITSCLSWKENTASDHINQMMVIVHLTSKWRLRSRIPKHTFFFTFPPGRRLTSSGFAAKNIKIGNWIIINRQATRYNKKIKKYKKIKERDNIQVTTTKKKKKKSEMLFENQFETTKFDNLSNG